MLSSWLSPQRRPHVPALAEARRLRVERLEDRTVPTVTGVFNGTASLVVGPVVKVGTADSSVQPTIAVNPLSPTTAFVMADNQSSMGQVAATTVNGGNGWTASMVNTLATMDGFGAGYRLDASTAYDRFGNLHIVYRYMTPGATTDPFNEAIIYARSVDNGQTFDNLQIIDFNQIRQFQQNAPHDPSYYPNRPDLPYLDKPQVATGPDAANPGNDAVFVTWADGGGNIEIRGANVSNLGQQINFSQPAFIGPSTAPFPTKANWGVNPQGNDYAYATVGPDGRVVVTWIDTQSGRLMFSQDQDGLKNGFLFTAPQVVTRTNTNVGDLIPATVDWVLPKNPGPPPPYQSSEFAFQGQFYAVVSGISARPTVAIDHSTGPHRGRIYLAYTDSITAGSADTDIQLRYSDDNGVTWSNATRVNDDSTKFSQFLSTVSVDDQGNVFLGWYDARNDRADGLPGDINTDNQPNTDVEFWGTASIDGGKTFLPNVKISSGSSNSFRAGNSENFGNYSGLAAVGGSAYAAWADNSPLKNSMSIFTGVMSIRSTGGETVNLTATGTGDNNWTIRLDPTGNFVEVFENSTNLNAAPNFTAAVGAVKNFVVKGGPGNDVLTIDDSNGNPVPAGGLTFDAGGQSGDMIVLQGGADIINSSDYNPTGPRAGTITTSNSGTITFTGVGRVEDLRPVTNQTLEATNDNDIINLVAGPNVNGTATLEYFLGNTQFTPYDLANKAKITAFGLDGANQFNVAASAVPLGTALTVDGGPRNVASGAGGNILFVDPAGTTGGRVQGTGIDSGIVTFTSGAPTITYVHISQASLRDIAGSTGTNPNPPDTSVTGRGGTGTGSGSGSGRGSGSGSGTGTGPGGTSALPVVRAPVINVMTSGNLQFAVGDVTGDGVPDVVVAAKDGSGALHVFVIDGARGGVTAAFTVFGGSQVSRFQLALIEVAGNGRLDILVAGVGRKGSLPVQVFDGLTGVRFLSVG